MHGIQVFDSADATGMQFAIIDNRVARLSPGLVLGELLEVCRPTESRFRSAIKAMRSFDLTVSVKYDLSGPHMGDASKKRFDPGERADGEHYMAIIVANKTVSDLQFGQEIAAWSDTLMLVDPEVHIPMNMSAEGWIVHTRRRSPESTDHDTSWFLMPSINLDNKWTERSRALHKKIIDMRQSFPSIDLSIQLLREAVKIDTYSLARPMMMFAVLDSILARSEKSGNRSHYEEIFSKVTLLGEHFRYEIDKNDLLDHARNKKFWLALYDVRNRIAHGKDVKINNLPPELQTIQAAGDFVKNVSRFILRSAAHEPSLVVNLRDV